MCRGRSGAGSHVRGLTQVCTDGSGHGERARHTRCGVWAQLGHTAWRVVSWLVVSWLVVSWRVVSWRVVLWLVVSWLVAPSADLHQAGEEGAVPRPDCLLGSHPEGPTTSTHCPSVAQTWLRGAPSAPLPAMESVFRVSEHHGRVQARERLRCTSSALPGPTESHTDPRWTLGPRRSRVCSWGLRGSEGSALARAQSTHDFMSPCGYWELVEASELGLCCRNWVTEV